MQVSKLQLFSIGYAMENKKLSSKNLYITPIELLAYLDGDIVHEETKDTTEGVDYFGEHYSVSAISSNGLEAEWMPLGDSNRDTAPDIRRGARLLLYRYADADKYYWVDPGMDSGIKRLETVRWTFSNTKDESVKALSADNSWYMELSTHTKLITLATNKSDGEKFAYTIQVNAKEGAVTISDDVGNFFEIDSEERKLTLKNKDGSYFILDKGKGYWSTPESIDIDTREYSVKCLNYKMNATNSITETTKTRTSAGDTNSVDYNKSTFTKLVDVSGLLTIKAGIAATAGGGATASFAIPMNVTAAANFTGTLTNNNIVFGTHTHTDSMNGNTSGPLAA